MSERQGNDAAERPLGDHAPGEQTEQVHSSVGEFPPDEETMAGYLAIARIQCYIEDHGLNPPVRETVLALAHVFELVGVPEARLPRRIGAAVIAAFGRDRWAPIYADGLMIYRLHALCAPPEK